VLEIVNADGKLPLWQAIGDKDPTEIKRLVRVYPPALVATVGGKAILQHFKDSISNYDLLVECYFAFKEHCFHRLIELCGTSDALEALVAALSEDDLSLHVLCCRRS